MRIFFGVLQHFCGVGDKEYAYDENQLYGNDVVHHKIGVEIRVGRKNTITNNKNSPNESKESLITYFMMQEYFCCYYTKTARLY